MIAVVLLGCSGAGDDDSFDGADGGSESSGSKSGRGARPSKHDGEGDGIGELGARGGSGSTAEPDAGAPADQDEVEPVEDETDEPAAIEPTAGAGGSAGMMAGGSGGNVEAGAGAGGASGSMAPAERVLWTYEAPEKRQFSSAAYVAYQRAFFTFFFGPCDQRLGGDAPVIIDDLRTDRFEANAGVLPAMLECARAFNGTPASDSVILIYAQVRKPNEALGSGFGSSDIGWQGTGTAFAAVKDNTITAFKREVLKYTVVEKNGGSDVTASVRWSILGY